MLFKLHLQLPKVGARFVRDTRYAVKLRLYLVEPRDDLRPESVEAFQDGQDCRVRAVLLF